VLLLLTQSCSALCFLGCDHSISFVWLFPIFPPVMALVWPTSGALGTDADGCAAGILWGHGQAGCGGDGWIGSSFGALPLLARTQH
jgi:hypothetical protein